MLLYSFTDIYHTMFFGILLINLWIYYYLYTNSTTTPKNSFLDSNIKKSIKITNNIYAVLLGLLLIWWYILNFIYVQINCVSILFFGTFYLSNNNLFFLCASALVLLIIVGSSFLLQKQNITFSIEYILFIYLIIIASYLLISSSNLFTTIFFLEFVALLIFGKFSVSKILINNNKTNNVKPTYMVTYSYGLFNSLFFQFWANFISSVFLFFSLINIHYSCGTSNFFMLNFIFKIMSINLYVPEHINMFMFILFITGLFIKLGLSPYQFFKIEIYKGIPIFLVVVYTTLYLLIYIYFFIYLYFYQVTSLKEFTGMYLLIVLTFSMLYLVSLLFDTKNFKAFLSYSTLVTVLNLLVVILII